MMDVMMTWLLLYLIALPIYLHAQQRPSADRVLFCFEYFVRHYNISSVAYIITLTEV